MNLDKLKDPFDASDIEWRIGSSNVDKTSGLALAYVTNRAIQDRLDEVAGPLNWRNEFERWNGKGVKCGISVRDGENGEWITKYDGADDTNIEPTKGGFSDSMKRAAVQWGIGRYLYDLPSPWVPLENGRLTKDGIDDLQKRYTAYVEKRYNKKQQPKFTVSPKKK